MALLLVVTFTWGVLCASGWRIETASRPPNVLFIAIDDLNDWVGCLGGNPQARTPNIDRIATRGTTFTNPSRISLLSGKLPSSTGVYYITPLIREYEGTRNLVTLPHIGDALIGVGQETNFVELNRARPEDEQIEVLSYGINPQVHAVDNAPIIETLPIQGDTVRSAQQFIGDRRLIVDPITLCPQPVNQKPADGELPSNVDVRQPWQFVAGWTLGSIKYLAEAGAESTTYYETVGWKGIMDADEMIPQRAKFPTCPGQVFGAYHVFREIADFVDEEVVKLDTSDALSVIGIALTNGKQLRIVVANLTGEKTTLAFQGVGKEREIWVLDELNSTAANSNPEEFHNRPGTPWPQKTPIVLSLLRNLSHRMCNRKISCITYYRSSSYPRSFP